MVSLSASRFGYVAAFALFCSPASGEHESPPKPRPQFGNFGGVGLLETRSARMAPDRTLSATVAVSPSLQRYAITFQAAPWLEGTFNYKIFDLAPSGNELFDRQFDLKLRLLPEGPHNPEISVGLQDFLGTGVFGGEYIVASKMFGPLDLSLGVGWGRLASRGTVANPLRTLSARFGDRDAFDGVGGEVNFGNFFQGRDIGIFGGVIYDTPIDGLRLIAEYDSDDKDPVEDFEDDFPVNIGVSYTPFDGLSITGSLLNGSEVNLAAAISADIGRQLRDAPKAADLKPFAVREGRGIDPKGDVSDPPIPPRRATPVVHDVNQLATPLKERLESEGIDVRHLVLGVRAVQVSIENRDLRSVPKAAGRTVRILTELAPVDVEEFRIIIMERGMETAQIDVDRERLETSARERGYTASPPPFLNAYHSSDIGQLKGAVLDLARFPRLSWSVGPDIRLSTFDPDAPLRFNFDIVAAASLELFTGAFLSGALRADVFGNFDEIDRESDSVLPRVRSDFARYYRETDIGVDRLAADYFTKLSDNVYAKASAGLLEQHFGGIGGEVLYRPPLSSFAYGAELFYAKQRDFDTLFEFQDYDVVTGHASLYYDTDFYDLDLALHAGRYLAGDWGVTFEATRRFSNGWEVGAFATFTDVPFDDFGEGSFDKGLIFRIPFHWGLPYETRSEADIALRPVQRDGGQRLEPGSRLFRLTQPSSHSDMAKQWNEFSH